MQLDKRSRTFKICSSLGIEPEEYEKKIQEGLSICTHCARWKIISEFSSDNGRNSSKNKIYNTCKTCKNNYQKKRYRIFNATYIHKQYKANAKHRDYEFLLTIDDFQKLITAECHYCGDSDVKLGYDRINNQIGYTLENVVPCCWKCNHMKYKCTKQEWFDHMLKILSNNGILTLKEGN